MTHTGGGLTPRAAHTAVYVEEVDSLFVYGGYDLNRVLGELSNILTLLNFFYLPLLPKKILQILTAA